MNIPPLALGMKDEYQVPDFNEWLAYADTQLVLQDIYHTLVLGAEKWPFWSYIEGPTQGSFEKQKAAAFRHSLPVHESNGHAIDKDSGKPHLANMLTRAFIARGQQLQLGEKPEEVIEE